MKFFITKKKLIKTMAEELAFLQIMADSWYYVRGNSAIASVREESRNMSSFMLDKVTELRCICHKFGILSEVYTEAYKIYDFRQSGKEGFVPDQDLIRKLEREFCEPLRKKRLFM